MSYWTIDSAERLLVPEKLLDLMALRPVMSESAYRRSGWLYHRKPPEAPGFSRGEHEPLNIRLNDGILRA